MQQIQLYIESTRADLFEDESIVVTDAIQDVKDISKIYTAFSQQFNLPATDVNNKLFKHYYNSRLINGFDARQKVNAIIKVNGVDYKKGKIVLNSVDLKDNKPYSYKVVFYGNTVTLKDLLGDDMLDQLPLSQFDHEYNATNIQTGLESNLFSGAIKYPFISHTRNFDVDTTNGVYVYNTTYDRLNYSDLKPSIRLTSIIYAIEQKYGLDFSGLSFLNSYYFYHLFLWLHRSKGAVSNGDDVKQIVTNIEDLTFDSGDEIRPLSTVYYRYAKIEWTVTVPSPSSEFTVKILDKSTGDFILEAQGTGTTTFDFSNYESLRLWSSALKVWDLDFIIESENTLGITQALTFDVYNDPIWEGLTFTSGTYSVSSEDTLNIVSISQNMPKMKVIDFLTTIFKMHNLTASVNDDNALNEVINVESLPDYYNEFKSYDITNYVDVSKTSIERFFPYKSIDFSYDGRSTFLTIATDATRPNSVGNLNWNESSESFDGGKYEIKLPLERLVFERMNYVDTDAASPIQSGWHVDKDMNANVGKPIIHFIENRSGGSDMKFDNGVTVDTLSTYNAPSNTVTISGKEHSLSWGNELDEFTYELNENSLYKKYYDLYIQSIYNALGRKLICDAYLPISILLQYKLNDRFLVNGVIYKISTLKTNFKTQKTSLELLVDMTYVNGFAFGNQINYEAPYVNDLVVTSDTLGILQVDWTAVSGATSYNVYLDGEFVINQPILFYRNTGLTDKFNYKVGIQAVFSGYSSRISNIIVDLQ